MDNDTIAKPGPGAAFWILGVLFLLWNAFGCFMYLFDKLASDEALLAMENGQAMLEARHAYPIWATVAYAIAVWGGLLAAVLYLIRKKWAVNTFIVSLIAAVICFIPTFTMPSVQVAGGDTYWLMPVIVVLLGLFEVWWSRMQRAKGNLS